MKLSSFLKGFWGPSLPKPKPVTEPLDLLANEFVQNPYPYYAWLREHDPVHRLKTGGWLLTRYADVSLALENPQLRNSPSPISVLHTRNSEKYTCASVANNILPFWDGDKHQQPRKVVVNAFKELLANQQTYYDAAASELISELELFKKSPQRIELLSEFASPYALKCMCESFGIPLTDSPKLKEWTNDFFYLFTQIPTAEIRDRLNHSLQEFRHYLDDLITAQINNNSTTLPILLMQHDAKQNFSRSELIDNCLLIFADGIENVDSGIGNMMYTLCRHPEVFERLREQPQFRRAVVNEVLRVEAPAQYIGRIAESDIQIGQRTIKKNSPVILALASANRDSEMFSEGELFNPRRESSPLLSFGRGKHSCIGAPLVRLQLDACLQALLQISATWKIDEDRLQEGLSWQNRPGHRWLESLPLVAK